MLRLRSSVDHGRAHHLGEALRDLDGVKRIVRQADDDGDAGVVFVADVEPEAADHLIAAIAELGIPLEDYVLERVEVVAPERRHLTGRGDFGGFAWVEVMGQARANSRPLARYLALINVAAVIAALGVIKSSSILIVGAMAVSPDLLPICATCVGIVAARRPLAVRAFLTLWLGLALVVVTAAVLTWALKAVELLPSDFSIHSSTLSTLASTDYSTVLIALAAGIAAILSFETRASAAVGVAISVTTIPASAYLGVAIGGGGTDSALGALVVLVVNVGLMIVSGTTTLLVQRRIAERATARTKRA
ncbi:MAG TPA: DUF389 domain-containing protein [Solirubrobacterales bacterium]|nr:DUF389 domain-containing protein [Solirubrobacterales bacterium]